MPVSRNPYSQFTAPALRPIFNEHRGDVDQLQLIEETLRGRSSDAARTLHLEVEQEIEALLANTQIVAQVAAQPNSLDVFISYAREDANVAEAVRACLEGAGLNVWMDRVRLTPGSHFPSDIGVAIRRSKCLLVLWSRHAVGSFFVNKEISDGYAMERSIIPLRLDDAAFSDFFRHVSAGCQWFDGRAGLQIRELTAWAKVLRPEARSAPGRVIAVMNAKGGVGKTTIAANVFGSLHVLFKKSVLFIDLDSQSNLSQLLVSPRAYTSHVQNGAGVLSLFEPHRFKPETSSQRLFDTAFARAEAVNPSAICLPLARLDREGVRFDIILGQFEIIKYGLLLNRRQLDPLMANFARFIETARRIYDYVIIDLGPTASFIHECTVQSATHILCPIRPDKYSFEGIETMDRLLRDVFLSCPRSRGQ